MKRFGSFGDIQLTYPRVKSVRPLAGKRLLVAFATGEERFYDCSPLLAESAFAALADETRFQRVRADPPGYGVVWIHEIDLAESELWINGSSAEPAAPPHAAKPRRLASPVITLSIGLTSGRIWT